MRLLQLHSDFIEYEPVEKEIREAEEIQSKARVRLEDLVVAFVAVENGDDESVAKAAAADAARMKDPRSVEFLAWFAQQTPKRPAPMSGLGGAVPGLPGDLPERPDISLPPGGLNLDKIGTGPPEVIVV